MDCMATSDALESSLRRDRFTGSVDNVSSDDFSIDDLLDFSDKDFKDGSDVEEETASFLVSSQHHTSYSSTFSDTDYFGSLLAVPADDLESLEWLSQFVDDSQSELSLLCPARSFNDKSDSCVKDRIEPARVPCFSVPVPRKPRSVRPKGHHRAWSASTSLTTESSSFSSSSSNGSCTMSPFVYANPVQDFEFLSSVEKPRAKKQKKNPAADTESGSNGSQVFRRCSHCQVQKTPQWRTGPLGPKTLCNACGVRYKSGRLFPEYRPACSPTFSQEMHSNSHRKVLEMRRKKEMAGPGEAGFAPMVPSF